MADQSNRLFPLQSFPSSLKTIACPRLIVGRGSPYPTCIFQAFIVSNKAGYVVVLDPGRTAAKSFGVPDMPYYLIIGRSGLVVYRGSGLSEDVDHFLTQ